MSVKVGVALSGCILLGAFVAEAKPVDKLYEEAVRLLENRKQEPPEEWARKAIKKLEEAYEREPEHKKAYYSLAYAHEVLGDFERAAEIYAVFEEPGMVDFGWRDHARIHRITCEFLAQSQNVIGGPINKPNPTRTNKIMSMGTPVGSTMSLLTDVAVSINKAAELSEPDKEVLQEQIAHQVQMSRGRLQQYTAVDTITELLRAVEYLVDLAGAYGVTETVRESVDSLGWRVMKRWPDAGFAESSVGGGPKVHGPPADHGMVLREALTLLENRERRESNQWLPDAMEKLEQALKLSPEDNQLRFGLATALEAGGKFLRASDLYKLVEESSGDDGGLKAQARVHRITCDFLAQSQKRKKEPKRAEAAVADVAAGDSSETDSFLGSAVDFLQDVGEGLADVAGDLGVHQAIMTRYLSDESFGDLKRGSAIDQAIQLAVIVGLLVDLGQAHGVTGDVQNHLVNQGWNATDEWPDAEFAKPIEGHPSTNEAKLEYVHTRTAMELSDVAKALVGEWKLIPYPLPGRWEEAGLEPETIRTGTYDHQPNRNCPSIKSTITREPMSMFGEGGKLIATFSERGASTASDCTDGPMRTIHSPTTWEVTSRCDCSISDSILRMECHSQYKSSAWRVIEEYDDPQDTANIFDRREVTDFEAIESSLRSWMEWRIEDGRLTLIRGGSEEYGTHEATWRRQISVVYVRNGLQE